jgi:hypothetical protein
MLMLMLLQHEEGQDALSFSLRISENTRTHARFLMIERVWRAQV